jgi:hypothetical protein
MIIQFHRYSKKERASKEKRASHAERAPVELSRLRRELNGAGGDAEKAKKADTDFRR